MALFVNFFPRIDLQHCPCCFGKPNTGCIEQRPEPLKRQFPSLRWAVETALAEHFSSFGNGPAPKPHRADSEVIAADCFSFQSKV